MIKLYNYFRKLFSPLSNMDVEYYYTWLVLGKRAFFNELDKHEMEKIRKYLHSLYLTIIEVNIEVNWLIKKVK